MITLSEKIAQRYNDGMMDLANVIAEEETLARCRRMNDIAVAPLGASTVSNSISMDIVRFGIAVAAFRELWRHANDAIRQFKNHHGSVVNVQTRVGNNRMSRQQSFSPAMGQQRAINMEHAGMVSSAWEDARMVASKSAQLLHALATLQHNKLNNKDDYDNKEEGLASMVDRPGRNTKMEGLVEEQKGVQAILGEHWDHQHNNMDDTISGGFSLPPLQLFDPLLVKLQTALPTQ